MNRNRLIIFSILLASTPILPGADRDFILNPVHIHFVDENNEVLRKLTLSPEQLQLLQRESTYFNDLPSEFFKQKAPIPLPIDNVNPDAFDLLLRLPLQDKAAIEQHLKKVAPELIFHIILTADFLGVDKLQKIALSKEKIQELATYLMGQKDKLARLTMPSKNTMCSPDTLYPLTIKKSHILPYGEGTGLFYGGFSPDSKHIATMDLDNNFVSIWNVSTGDKRTLALPTTGRMYEHYWSPDSNYIIAGYNRNQGVRIWDISTGKVKWKFAGDGSNIAFASWSSDGRRIDTLSHSGTWCILNALTGKQEHEFLVNRSFIGAFMALSPDRRRIAIASNAAFGGGDTINILNAATGQIEHTLTGFTRYHFRLMISWSPDGKQIAASSDGESVRIWNTLTGEQEHILTGLSTSVSWSPDGKYIAIGSEDKGISVVRIWDTSVWKEMKFFIKGRQVGWSPDGRHILCAAKNDAGIFNVLTGQLEYMLPDRVGEASWSFDGKYIVTADRTSMRIWPCHLLVPDYIGLDELLISTALLNGATIDNTIFNMLSRNSIDFLLSADAQIAPTMKKMLEATRKKRPADEPADEDVALQPLPKKKKLRDVEE